ncbi:hypothetical protein E4U53_001697 [Claviceps sorghi]|nr:hypothetical protein E4U53_001697 [Claviceps sorghi]
MPRDRNMDNAPPSGQSKRPPLHQRDSDSQSDTTNTIGAPPHQHRTKAHPKHHHHVGRLSTRVPSTKAFHKHTNAHGPPPKLIRRQTAGAASPNEPHPPPHRRATSEVKLSHQLSSAHLPKSLSQSSLKRNRSHVEVSKRTRSSDKLKRTSSGTGIHRHTRKTSKTQVHFDLGSDDPEDEWVDASGSNSPYLSRKGSINSSTPSSLRPSTEEPRPATPNAPAQTHMQQLQQKEEEEQRQRQQQEQQRQLQVHHQKLMQQQQEQQEQQRQRQLQRQKLMQQQQSQQQQQQSQQQQQPPPPPPSEPHQEPKQQQQKQQRPQYSTSPADKATSQHKEYLTSRLLQRNTSHSAPPMMTADMAKGAPAQAAKSIHSADRMETPPAGSSNQEDLVSRFMGVPGSGQASHGSFYQQSAHGTSQILNDDSRRLNNSFTLDQPPQRPEPESLDSDEMDTSALIPKSSRRSAALPAEISRTQQKLNLQRASSVLQPGHGLSGAGGAIGSSPFIAVGGPSYDGGSSRDPRIGKLLERTGMEYLVVRRYQNPIARSLNRLSRLSGMEKTRKTRAPASAVNVKRGHVLDVTARHTRNVSMPDPRLSGSKRGGTSQANGAGSTFEGDDVSRISERLSGVSLVGVEEDDGINTRLRHLWDKPVDLGAGAGAD